MVTSGTHVNGGCCFDYGNAESNNLDTGAGSMEAVYFGTSKDWGCEGGGGGGLPGSTLHKLSPSSSPSRPQSARARARGSWPTWRTASGRATTG